MGKKLRVWRSQNCCTRKRPLPSVPGSYQGGTFLQEHFELTVDGWCPWDSHCWSNDSLLRSCIACHCDKCYLLAHRDQGAVYLRNSVHCADSLYIKVVTRQLPYITMVIYLVIFLNPAAFANPMVKSIAYLPWSRCLATSLRKRISIPQTIGNYYLLSTTSLEKPRFPIYLSSHQGSCRCLFTPQAGLDKNDVMKAPRALYDLCIL